MLYKTKLGLFVLAAVLLMLLLRFHFDSGRGSKMGPVELTRASLARMEKWFLRYWDSHGNWPSTNSWKEVLLNEMDDKSGAIANHRFFDVWGSEFKYVITETNGIIYSVGRNQVDENCGGDDIFWEVFRVQPDEKVISR